MPFQPINFAGLPIRQGSFLPENLAQKLMEGIAIKNAPVQREASELANAMKRMQVEGYPEDQRIANALKEAQTQKYLQEVNNPFMANKITGDLADVQNLKLLESQYGKDSKEYKMGEKILERKGQTQDFLNRYRNTLTELAPKRSSSPQSKQYQELIDAEDGFYPGTNRPIDDPEKQQEIINQLSQSILKKSTDRAVRQKIEYATNIDKTVDSLNVDDLVQYGGVEGKIKLKADKLQSAFGSPPKEYLAYQTALNKALLLRKQIRQFYGDSITPTMDERLQKLTEPATWENSPEVAKNMFNELVKVVKSETKTYKSAAKSTDLYMNKSEDKKLTGTIVGKDGSVKQVSVSPQNRAAFEKAGGKINE